METVPFHDKTRDRTLAKLKSFEVSEVTFSNGIVGNIYCDIIFIHSKASRVRNIKIV